MVTLPYMHTSASIVQCILSHLSFENITFLLKEQQQQTNKQTQIKIKQTRNYRYEENLEASFHIQFSNNKFYPRVVYLVENNSKFEQKSSIKINISELCHCLFLK